MSIADNSRSFSPKLIRNGTEVPLQEHILNLPILTITTAGGVGITSKTTYVNATFELRNTTQPFTQAGQIRGRGNSTWDQVKKPYKIKFGANVAPLGMVNRKEWVLLANFFDESSIRSAIAFEVGYRTSLAWTPQYRYVDVVLNGVKIGIYQMVDQIEVKSNRINIDEMTSADVSGLAVTGGYSMEIDVRMEENSEPGFRTRMNVPVTLDEPNGSVPAQVAYIRGFIQEFEDVLFSSNFAHPTDGFRKYIDINSFIDWYWVNEFLANNDSGFGASVKMYKTRDTLQAPGKLCMGPLWDFDRSIDIGALYPDHPADAWWTRNGASWVVRMMEDPVFVTLLKQRWALLRDAVLAGNFLYDFIDTLANKIYPQLVRDKEIWNLGPVDPDSTPAYIKNWLQQRIAWIDSELVASSDTTPPTVPQNVTAGTISVYEITLGWDDSTDTGAWPGVTGYRIWMDGEIVGLTAIPYSQTLTSFKVVGLSSGSSHDFEVQARDATGNWSAKSAVYTVATQPSPSPGRLSVFFDDAPGTVSAYNDGRPIILGSTFYAYGEDYGHNRLCLGGRVWVPNDPQLLGQITIGIWTNYTIVNDRVFFDLTQPPLHSKTVTVATQSSWTEVEWDTPVPLDLSTPVLIAYHFVDAPNKYLASTISNSVTAPNLVSNPGIYLSAANEVTPSGVAFSRSYFMYQDNLQTGNSGGHYGADIIVNEPF